MPHTTSPLPDYDVAIVGGGASGIYTAWRLLTDGVHDSTEIKKWQGERGELRVAVFEGSNRIGGRLLSAKSPALPDVVCELGGMRIVSSQKIVTSLVEKLGVSKTEQSVAEPHNLAYLRGKRLTTADLDKPKSLPYQLTVEESDWLSQGNPASDFIGFAVEKLFPGISSYHGDKLREYLRKQTIDDIPLYQHGLWNLLATVLSHEAYVLAIAAVGYDCLGGNNNAVDAICEYFDFTPDVKYYLLDDGFDSVLWTMQDEFQRAGGSVQTGKVLEGFEELQHSEPGSGVTLRFQDGSTCTARSIVLAMPRRSIELLAQRGPVLDPERAPAVRHLLNSVTPIELYKMFIAYERQWWNDGVDPSRQLTEGRSITDIPIRQCYYWGTEDQPSNKHSLLMVYNDATSSEFWGGLRQVPLGPGSTTTEVAAGGDFHQEQLNNLSDKKKNPWDKYLYNNWKTHNPPKMMVKEMHRQLAILHDHPDAPPPLDAAYMDWADDPYGGAVHFWNSGYDSSIVLPAMIQPVADFPCYVCGEAFSTNQTWVEGALQTAEMVLGKFGLSAPQWLSENE